ncbi:hypothetical protein ASG67_06925 [Sphingomonas sp. Leaf339]|uniref:hypothetical protein n=1 Tax=Sphingomonas sp. Leaf339 TaxID=1736343 RepID=UPI0006FFA899|nr:hypothetical protein [Sphingomonas sp. Leaf339]KQU55839.1 hypothetical protein ASG67_06925 [Sphingomonas sp. Leaf339]
MWTNVVLFILLQVVISCYAGWRGGKPERFVAIAMFAAALATLIAYAPLSKRFVGVETGVLAVDVSLFVGLTVIALNANRYWPMAMASLQLASLIVHFGKLLDLTMGGWAYAFFLKLWAYPMLLTLVVATMRHRHRLGIHGVDQPWTIFNAR